jgi:PII-like signaling protein
VIVKDSLHARTYRTQPRIIPGVVRDYAEDMLQKGDAKKVTIFVNEDTQHHFSPLADAILTFLLHKGVSGATATRAIAGFGAHQVMHTTRVEVLAEHLPVRIEFIESAQKVEELLPALYDMVTDGVIEVQDTHVIKAATKERAEPKTPHTELRGKARMMRIYLGESDRWHGEALYESIVNRLRVLEIAGATVYRGILGYGVKGHTHKGGKLPFSRDLPIMISVVDTPEKLDKAIGEIEGMLEDGLIVLSDVDMIRLVRSQPPAESSDANG